MLLGMILAILFPSISFALCTGSGPYTCSNMADLETMLESNNPAWTNGAVITIAAGPHTVSSAIVFSGGKNFTLSGNGAATLKPSAGLAASQLPMMTIHTVPGAGPTRITGIRWDQNGLGNGNKGALFVRGNSHQVRIDHNDFVPNGTVPLQFYDDVRGVVDHNVCDWSTGGGGICVYTMHDRWDLENDGLMDGFFGDSSWADDNTYGTADALIFEDNTFDYNYVNGVGANFKAATDGWNGQRVAYRFNHLRCSVLANHGTESGGRQRGGRMIEAYHNVYEALNGCNIHTMVDMRGGGLFAFNNTGSITGTNTLDAELDGPKLKQINAAIGGQQAFAPFGMCGQMDATTKYGSVTITSVGSTATITFNGTNPNAPNGTNPPTNGVDGLEKWWSGAGETFITVTGADQVNYNGTYKVTTAGTNITATYTCKDGNPCGVSPATGAIHITSPWNQNTNSSGVLCLDQPGTGKSDFLSGLDNPTLDGGSQTNPIAGWPSQGLLPVFGVNNTVGATQLPVTLHTPAQSAFIVENTHFYTHQTTFDGTVGIGYGSRGARPLTCVAGVLYFATNGGGNWNTTNGTANDGAVDKCTATNTWEDNWYVPYTYPHPLIAVTDGATVKSRLSGTMRIR